MESPWKKFLHTILQNDYDRMIEAYYNLRKMFQDNNIKKSQLEKGQGLTNLMYLERDLVIMLLSKITKDLEKYGLLGDKREEFTEYIQNKLHTIDNETPLKD
jgi:hypothetical protein